MDKPLETYLKANGSFIDTIVETATGWIVRLPVGQLSKTPEEVCRLLSEVDKDFKGYWLGSQANAFFVPSLAQRLKKNLAECLEISSKLDIDPQKEIINSKKPENDEEARALFHVIADKKILSSNNDQEPNIINIEKDQEAAFHTIKNYFTPKKTIETQAAINLLLDKGVNHSQIAAKVGVSQASIYRLASLKKNS